MENTLKERLKILRYEEGLTQEEFAKRIGIKRNSYANYEIGRSSPIDAVIYSICREFNVHENWLRTGKGKMYRSTMDEEKINKWVKRVFSDESAQFKQRFMLMLHGLSKEQWEELESFAVFLAAKNNWDGSESRPLEE